MTTSNTDSRTEGMHSPEAVSSKSRAILPSLPVIIVFVAITVMAWLIPLRPVTSQTENRNLERFPQFTVAALFDGSYFDDISVWFSDTFTFRETWISTTKKLETLYGTRTVAIYGDIGSNDDIPEIIVSTQNTEPYATDPTKPTDTDPSEKPEKEFDPREEGMQEAPDDATQSAWGGQVIAEEDYINRGAVIQIGNATYIYTGFSQNNADRYAAAMNKAVDRLDGRARLFCVLGLENTTFMLTREDRIAMGCKPEEDAVDYMYSKMDPRVNTVRIYDNMIAHNSEYLAFRTDHHWTATGAYYAYEAWCREAGFEPVPLSEYEVIEYPGFYGSYYARAGQSKLLKEDTVVCYVPPGNVKLYLSDENSDSLGWEQPLITDRSRSKPNSKYLAFLAGDHAKGTFINDDITDGSSCVVIKTSVGNPFVYYLTQHYQYVYVLDIRYYSYRNLSSFVKRYEVDDVIFMHGAGLAMGSGGSSLITSFVN